MILMDRALVCYMFNCLFFTLFKRSYQKRSGLVEFLQRVHLRKRIAQERSCPDGVRGDSLTSPVSCLMHPVFWLLPPSSFPRLMSRVRSPVSSLMSPVAHFQFHMFCLTSHISVAVSADNIADLAVLWSKLVELGNLVLLIFSILHLAEQDLRYQVQQKLAFFTH